MAEQPPQGWVVSDLTSLIDAVDLSPLAQSARSVI